MTRKKTPKSAPKKSTKLDESTLATVNGGAAYSPSYGSTAPWGYYNGGGLNGR